MSTLYSYEIEELLPVSQGYEYILSTQAMVCLGTPGSCGCIDCEKFKNNRFAKKVFVFGQETGWVWEDKTHTKMDAFAKESRRLIDQCASTNTYCGCDICNRILLAVEQQGVDELTVFGWKQMNLDTGEFVWDYDEVQKKLDIVL